MSTNRSRRPPQALSLALLLAFAGCRADPAMPNSLDAAPARVATPTEFVASTDAWHAGRVERLAAPHGWLSLVALAWLNEGENRVGSAPDAEVSYAGLPAPRVGKLTVQGERVTFAAAEGVTVEGVPADGVLVTDAQGSPTQLAVGDVRFYVIVRSGQLAVRMKDPAAPTRAAFTGIERYPVDASWRLTAELVPAPEGTRRDVDTVLGTTSETAILGHARFTLGGHAVSAVLFDHGDGSSTLRFADATSGRETYGAGRYLTVPPPTDGPNGPVVELDFNRAYNPPCAYTEFATCSLAPPENRFPFAVTAGERFAGEH